MDTGKLRNQYDETVDPTQPVPVDTVEAQRKVAISETLTYNGKAAAGAVTINSVAQKAIVSVEGDQVASYWGLEKNKMYEAKADFMAKAGEPRLMSVTETNGSAAVVIMDPDKDLELLLESLTTTVKRYVIRVKDTTGATLYGWIFGVAKSTNTYTIDVVNNRLTETQNWVGTLADFTHTSLAKVEIFRYNSSLTFGTGTTLTEEVESPREYSKSWFSILKYASEKLTNGQYFVDYMRGRIIGKKADNTASETVSYNVWSNTSTAVTSAGAEVGAVDNTNNVIATVNKPLAVSTYAWSVDQSAALEASTVTKASAGVLRSATVRIDSTQATGTYYIQFYNAAALPADGAVTFLCAPYKIQHTTGTDTHVSFDFTDNGIYASTGIVMGLSTTEFTKTISGAVTSSTILYK